MAADAGDLAVMLQRIPVAHHRQLFLRPPGVETLALHLRPADAIEAGIRQALLQRRDQVAGQQVAGCLPGDQGNAYRLAHVSG